MSLLKKMHAALVASAVFALPANLSAQDPYIAPVVDDYVSPVAANAANIRRLNIMLMVTSLRCRATEHDFQNEYRLFSAAHQQNLEEARDALGKELVAVHGEAGINRALDRIGVSIANRYGDGHPTLGCSDLKEVTLSLAMSQDRTRLSQMADRLLDGPVKASAPLEAGEASPEPVIETRPPYVPNTGVPHFGRG